MNLSTVIIVIAFVASILIISSSQISFAKKNDKEEEYDKDLKKDIPVSSIDKTKDSNKIEVQNDILNDHYPNQYYVCGYPQQLITDYNFIKKVNCN
jgi:hypothetical protein